MTYIIIKSLIFTGCYSKLSISSRFPGGTEERAGSSVCPSVLSAQRCDKNEKEAPGRGKGKLEEEIACGIRHGIVGTVSALE